MMRMMSAEYLRIVLRLPAATMLIVLSSCCCRGQAPSSRELGSGLEVGAAVEVITPSPLLPISGGMGPTSKATQKRGELTARAVVFRRGSTTVGIVALDLLGFPAVLGNRVRALVPEISPSNLLIAATHTHSAPDVYAFPDGQGGHSGELEYIDFVCRQAAKALQAARQGLMPARLRVATGEANGKIAYNYYAPDLYDRRVSVIQAADHEGRTIATLVNYAIHPEVLGSDAGILSPDLIGPLCDMLEDRTGGVALFVNSAQGGMVTADNRNLDEPSNSQRGYWKDSRTWSECERIGRTLAEESIRIVKDVAWESEPLLQCTHRDVTFPVESDAMWTVVVGSPLGYPHGERSITTRLNFLEIGNARILTIPGEALPNIGFYLKRKMGGKHNLLFGLTNDAFGYILTEVDFQSFPRYDYISRVSLGEKTGTILIENALELVREGSKRTEHLQPQ